MKSRDLCSPISGAQGYFPIVIAFVFTVDFALLIVAAFLIVVVVVVYCDSGR